MADKVKGDQYGRNATKESHKARNKVSDIWSAGNGW
jgi:hypothetical protein